MLSTEKAVAQRLRQILDPDAKYITESELWNIVRIANGHEHNAFNRGIAFLLQLANIKNDGELRLIARRKQRYYTAGAYKNDYTISSINAVAEEVTPEQLASGK